ncbi:MAG: bifunctional phosphoribosylaminoimidazolecarboxamide formyltransferase/IMP cyclohydrolase [Pirellulales bacterium]
MERSPKIRRALISVSDKQGLNEFARGLVVAGVELYSTGGTRGYLQGLGLKVADVSDYTGFPEMMDGRLKTLHPKIHGGILCRHDRPDDMQALRQHGILTFELVVVNLYPFEATVARPGTAFEQAIEQIDIGGPSLVRGASKNHAFTSIVTNPAQYAEVLQAVQSHGATTPGLRRRLARQAFALTAKYDTAIAAYFVQQIGEEDSAAANQAAADFPTELQLRLTRVEKLRYGENPHQAAALYADASAVGTHLTNARKLHGKELSYNNLLDLNSAMAIAGSLPDAAATVIKHNNPCGAASAETLAEAARNALDGDPVSAFGSVLGFNHPVDAVTADVLSEPGRFIEAIAAPKFLPEALELLRTRPKWKDNVRLVEVDLSGGAAGWEYRAIDGGFLVQQPDLLADPESDWKVVTEREPTHLQWTDLRFAWAVVRHVKSNAIVLCRDRALLGAGAGQMSRVDSVEISIRKAGERGRGSSLASDAFFPFPDSIDLAAAAGVAAVIQPGGSKKDPEVIAACNRHGIAMIFTGRRHFRH